MLAVEIEEVVNKLLYLKKYMHISEINEMEEFKQFKEENKLFYEIVLSDNMDMDIYRQMLKMKRKLESGEDQYSVDVKFGKYMAEKFVDPVIKNIPENK
jgi:nicotinate-nucleotide pyrophosphorylase